MTDAELLKRLQKVRDWMIVSGHADIKDEMNEIILKVTELLERKE